MKYIVLLISSLSFSQTNVIKGNFPQIKNTEIQLVGFNAIKDSLISKTTCDSLGKFTINYPTKYIGAALLQIKDTKSVIVLLNKENYSINWSNIEDFNSLKFINSPENEAFNNGVIINQEAESILSGLKFLKPLYDKNKAGKKWISAEIFAKQNAIQNFVNALPKDSYGKYYLSIRKMIADMPITASRYPERMPEHEKQFESIDFTDKNLIQSGLYKELLNAYYLLLESYGDKVYDHANTSTDALLKSLNKNPTLKQTIAEYLFNYLEKRSLYPASEHIALAMLDNQSCQLDGKRTALFEQYRKMAVGKTAPEIVFENPKTEITKLSDLKTKYKLVVFGSSWCHRCTEEMPRLNKLYKVWKTKYNLETAFISLDTDKEKYNTFIQDYSWIASCDFKSWEGQTARDYYVFGTPTIYLLDSNNKILLKPISPEHIDSWLQSFDK